MNQKPDTLNQKPILEKLLYAIGLIGAIFYFITLIAIPTPAAFLRGNHLLIIAVIVLLTKAIKAKGYKRVLYLLTILPALATYFYSAINLDDVLFRGGLFATNIDLMMAFLGISIVLFTTYVTIGPALPIFSIIFILYGLFGNYVPGYLGHAGYSINRILITLYGYDGINGMPTGVAATNLVMFIIFGQVIEITGIGDLLMIAAKKATRHLRGGAAKTAVLGSAFFGTISGSAVSNVVGTGTFTIPMMKSLGYSPVFAGAVEAVASTGGQIMPPIMASGAFIMAEMLGVTYSKLAISAALPAILYFVAAWITVDLRTQKLGMTKTPKTENDGNKTKTPMHNTLITLAPIVILVYLLFVAGWTPIRSAFSAIVIAYLGMQFTSSGSFLVKTKNFLGALQEGVISLSKVGPACACAGTVGGIIGMTGLGTKIAGAVASFSGGNLYIALFLCMFVAIIFGMAMPTTISYLLASTILSTTLIGLGLAPLAAHLFIFYFAVLSGITPPVALAAYAAAGISGAKPFETAVESVKIALPSFLIAYAFAVSPELLLIGETYNIIIAFITTAIGVFILAHATEGWAFNGRLYPINRIVLILSAALLIDVGLWTDILGLILAALAAIIEISIRRYKRNNTKN